MAVLQGYFPPSITNTFTANKPSPLQINLKSRNPTLPIPLKPQSTSKITRRCQAETTTFYTSTSEEDEDYFELDDDDAEESASGTKSSNRRAPLLKRRTRYRKAYPGESKGITEEMRFVAMKLRNSKSESGDDGEGSNLDPGGEKDCEDSVAETWIPSMEGLAKHLVDCKVVFETLERVVEQSDDVSYAYFRTTGLERSKGLAWDIEWLRERDVEIPEPGVPGVSYAKYLEDLSTDSAPLFLTHFYNVYFSHVAGGQVVLKQASDKILDGREFEFCRWDGNEQELLKEVKDKLNTLGEHWPRSDKNKCLSETAKAFKYMGQIVRLIIL